MFHSQTFFLVDLGRFCYSFSKSIVSLLKSELRRRYRKTLFFVFLKHFITMLSRIIRSNHNQFTRAFSSVYVYGENKYYQCGYMDPSPIVQPKELRSFNNIKVISPALNYTIAVTSIYFTFFSQKKE